MRVRRLFPLLLILGAPFVLADPPSAAAAPAGLQGLGAYVQQVMHDWHVPGLALAVVKDGKLHGVITASRLLSAALKEE